MKTTRRYIESLMSGLSQESGIQFKEGNIWSTDIEKRVITYNPIDLMKYDPFIVKGLVLHELGHVLFTTQTDDSDLAKEFDMQAVYNAFEDMRIEFELDRKYGNFSRQAHIFMNESINYEYMLDIEKNPKKNLFSQQSPLAKILLTILAYNEYNQHTFEFINNSRGDLPPSIMRGKIEYFREKLNTKEQEALDKLHSLLNLNANNMTVKKIKNTKELKEFVDQEVYPILKEFISIRKDQQKTNGRTKKRDIQESNTKPHKVPEALAEKIEEIKNTIMIESDEEILSHLSPYITTISQRMSDILKEKQSIKYEGFHYSGRLKAQNIYKIATGEDRIFSKRNNPHKPNYVMTIVLDGSGSMAGPRYTQTYKTGLMLTEIAKRMKFKTNIVEYSTTVRVNESMEPYRKPEFDGNNEARMIKKVSELLNPNDDNLLFILTDGGIGSDIRPDIRELKEKKNTTTIAIGVGLNDEYSNELKEYYQNAVSCENVEDLPMILLNQLKRIIHR